MLNTWGIYGKNIQEKEKMVKDAMTRFPPTGLNDAQLKEFTTTLNDWMQNPKKYEVNCLPGSMNFKKVGGSRSGKTRKQKRRRSLKKLKSRKAH